MCVCDCVLYGNIETKATQACNISSSVGASQATDFIFGCKSNWNFHSELLFHIRFFSAVDLLLKICNTHTHTQSVLHATANEWQQTKASQQNLSRRDHDCVARGGFLFAASQLQHSPSPAPVQLLPAPPSPLSTPLSSCVLMAHNVTHMPQSRVESSPQCRSQAWAKAKQKCGKLLSYYVGVRQPESYTIYNRLPDDWTKPDEAAFFTQNDGIWKTHGSNGTVQRHSGTEREKESKKPIWIYTVLVANLLR